MQKYLGKAIELSPQWLLPNLTLAMEYMYNLRDYAKAEEWLMKALDKDSTSYVLLERLVWLYQTTGHTDKARATAEKMVRLRPDLFNSYGNMGVVLFQTFDMEKAEPFLRKAHELNPDPGSWVHQYLGYVLMATRRQKEATALFRQMIADPGTSYWRSADYHTWFAKGLINFTTDQPMALELLDKAFQRRHMSANFSEISVWKAKATFMMKQWDETKRLLRQAFAYDSLYAGTCILVNTLWGELELQEGNFDRAEAWFKKALECPGDYFFMEEALYRFGVFLLSQGRLNEAENQFREAIRLTNDHGCYGYYGLALLTSLQQQNALALEYLEKSLDRFYPFPVTILSEPLFSSIKETAHFKTLMKKHFP